MNLPRRKFLKRAGLFIPASLAFPGIVKGQIAATHGDQAFLSRNAVSATASLNTNLANYWKEEESGANNRVDVVASVALVATSCTSIAGKHNNATSSNASAGSCGNTVNGFKMTAGLSVTYSLWFNMVANPGDFRAVQGQWMGVTKITLFLWFAGSTTLKLTADNAAGSSTANLTVAAPPTTATWHHIVFGYDDSAQQIWHCYDGAARTSAASVGVWNGDGANNMDYRQLAYAGGSGPINGAVDEVGRWTRVLTAAECTTLWNAGNGNFYPF